MIRGLTFWSLLWLVAPPGSDGSNLPDLADLVCRDFGHSYSTGNLMKNSFSGCVGVERTRITYRISCCASCVLFASFGIGRFTTTASQFSRRPRGCCPSSVGKDCVYTFRLGNSVNSRRRPESCSLDRFSSGFHLQIPPVHFFRARLHLFVRSRQRSGRKRIFQPDALDAVDSWCDGFSVSALSSRVGECPCSIFWSYTLLLCTSELGKNLHA